MNTTFVQRVNLSPYQRADFMEQERILLESIPGVRYVSEVPVEAKRIVLVTNTHTNLRDLDQDLLKRTSLIIHPNSGYDHFRSDHALWKSIPLVVGHNIRAQAVAEYSLGCLFEGLLEIPQHLTWDKQRRWERTLLKGLPVAIFGMGHIGTRVAAVLKSIGMEVFTVDAFNSRHLKSWRDLELPRMRAVIACMSLNSTSAKYFNHEFFAKAHPELLFINGARGGLVDEAALKEFLQTNPRAFAFLDVFEKEPFGPEWQGHPQVWKTSHIAGVHRDLDQGILDFEASVLKDYMTLTDVDFKMKYQQELLQNKWIQGELI